ncbi:MAG TPA: polyphosphate polymerase domain-containing protein [Solirubrobacteraceae bacterium]|nr:polyphosphate polymerase domain-containing protein [Solirubrobacteraceae bacterium]
MHELVERFDPVTLEELDERAALLRRVDHKYAVEPDQFARLLERLRDDHQVLEIDGQRAFGYCSTYFDTPELRCFADHVEDRRPRFKTRTRLYEDTDHCVFEVKLKREDGETDKRQLDYAARDAERFTDEARECLADALGDIGLDAPDRMDPTLLTRFNRITLAARDGSERLTCDLGVRLSHPDGEAADLRDGLILVETKSERGESPADRALAELGLEEISVSKYRVGMSLVGGGKRAPQPGAELFEPVG